MAGTDSSKLWEDDFDIDLRLITRPQSRSGQRAEHVNRPRVPRPTAAAANAVRSPALRAAVNRTFRTLDC